ncbi:MAG: hypothetical protein LPK09_06725 [Hymenobacteraceae bacterium]|nr:hypothetical protein [Hymenobacteraceae bacterium]
MIITSILTFVALFGTLVIVAYLRQVEDAMAELEAQPDTPVCPVCHISHHSHEDSKMHSNLRGIKFYYKSKRRAATKLYRSRRSIRK